MKKIAFLLLLLGSVTALSAQKVMTRTGHISFFSSTPAEDIEAHNQQATSLLDQATGDMVFMVLMKGFQFEKALMQEHFNEKYVESSKYPKATFKGALADLSQVDFEQAGSYPVAVSGDLTIHGVTRAVTTEGTLTVQEDGSVLAKATFPVAVADYEITVPSVVRDNIAKEVEVRVDLTYQPMEN